jgi:hypothetical protein
VSGKTRFAVRLRDRAHSVISETFRLNHARRPITGCSFVIHLTVGGKSTKFVTSITPSFDDLAQDCLRKWFKSHLKWEWSFLRP